MIHPLEYEELVRMALREDAPFGDPFGESLKGEAAGNFIAGGVGVFCGGPVAVEVFRQVDPSVSAAFVEEGKRLQPGERVGEARGPAGSLLRGERVALNFLQKLSGVATCTARYVERAAAYGTRILDTRKTTPLFRALEKYAVRTGGGANHRFSLSDGILIKENGIRAAGGIAEAVEAARRAVPHLARVEVEVETLEDAETAIAAGADAILLDNMPPEKVGEAVRRFGGSVFLEASGGIRLENVELYARTGVDAVSIGALTHSAPALDISFELLP
ncbi:MAG: carboxylating nicotinate-nucleotide diphosphorylase [Deltaproteobacteria bacterium]|nr:carboxylating nicotinate-nucleotide diphosphorylase [Deltaproteobacteria bacterium]